MSTEENKAIVRRAIEEGWNRGHVAVFDELNAPNFINHDPGAPGVRTKEDYKRWVTESLSAFPNFHMTIEDLIAEGDRVAMRWTFRGTNTGALVTPMPLPATGKQVTGSGVTIIRLVGEKAVEVWSQGDTLGFLQQLGVIPVPGNRHR
jgi:predicted ester cyclase